MDILGIGPLELALILIIALIFLGPNDMVKAGKTLGRFMRQVVTSPVWRTVQDTSKAVRNLPYTLMREAGFEEGEEIIPQDMMRIETDPKLLARKTQGPEQDPGQKPDAKQPEFGTWAGASSEEEPPRTIGTPQRLPEELPQSAPPQPENPAEQPAAPSPDDPNT